MATKAPYVVVMAGGKGTRFWPESTAKKPKQYLNIIDNSSLLEQTLKRFEGLVPIENRFIVTLKEQASFADQCSKGQIKRNALIFEPVGRNTAACIFLSILSLISRGVGEEETVMIVPSDHVILNIKAFQSDLSYACEMAVKENKISIIGISPYFPHTGFGYIKKGKNIDSNFFLVDKFVEKPNLSKAKEYLQSKEYLWNAGMFVAKISVLLQEFKKHCPEIYKFYDDLLSSLKNEKKLDSVYKEVPELSFDSSVLEKSENVVAMPANFDWNDLGSWEALENVCEKEKDNIWAHNINVNDDIFVSNSKGNVVYAPNQFVALVNVDDLVIVSNKKVLMILPKKDTQSVKEIVAAIKSNPNLKDLI